MTEVRSGRIGRWLDRVYAENDFERNLATSVAGFVGLLTYLQLEDGVTAVFAAVIAFPLVKIVSGSIRTRWNRSQERRRTRDEMKELFDSLGSEERIVVQAFVRHGGVAITWQECNRSEQFSAAGIESLSNRGMLHPSVTQDGMRETFVLDTELFDYARRALPDGPS